MSKIEIQIIVEAALNGIKKGLEDYYNWSDQLPIFMPEYITKGIHVLYYNSNPHSGEEYVAIQR